MHTSVSGNINNCTCKTVQLKSAETQTMEEGKRHFMLETGSRSFRDLHGFINREGRKITTGGIGRICRDPEMRSAIHLGCILISVSIARRNGAHDIGASQLLEGRVAAVRGKIEP